MYEIRSKSYRGNHYVYFVFARVDGRDVDIKDEKSDVHDLRSE